MKQVWYGYIKFALGAAVLVVREIDGPHRSLMLVRLEFFFF